MEEIMFVTRGDFVMPSVALTAARFSAKYGIGAFGETLFANTVLDPKKKDGKNMLSISIVMMKDVMVKCKNACFASDMVYRQDDCFSICW
jgi:hypothetical protein